MLSTLLTFILLSTTVPVTVASEEIKNPVEEVFVIDEMLDGEELIEKEEASV